MNFNLKCDIFKTNILNIINQSELPISVIYYILQNIYNQIQKTYYGTINQIRLEEQEKAKKELEEKINQNTQNIEEKQQKKIMKINKGKIE